jgi:hypothetical protein
MLRKLEKLKVEKIKLTGWITYKQLEKVIVLTKPKARCIKVEIEIVPIKKGVSKC